jgi:hypothetical protein
MVVGNEYFSGGGHAAASEGFIGRFDNFLELAGVQTIRTVLL